MKNCQNCKKSLKDLKTVYRAKGKEFCSTKCAKDFFKDKKIIKSINEEKYQKLTWKEKLSYVKEYKCKCNECGKTWNYLAKVEKEMNRQIFGNSLVHLGNCCNPCIALWASNANTQLSKQIKELKQCPNCKSSNVTYEAKYFPK